ncbi:MAG: hypothetical protein KY475_23425 [Planctomycetes bacterium]|nr:hypothetical protein [Planctomycetota bacterium]
MKLHNANRKAVIDGDAFDEVPIVVTVKRVINPPMVKARLKTGGEGRGKGFASSPHAS